MSHRKDIINRLAYYAPIKHVDYVTCECEHLDHENDAPFVHKKSALFEAESLHKIATVYGTFYVCAECDVIHIPNEYRKDVK